MRHATLLATTVALAVSAPAASARQAPPDPVSTPAPHVETTTTTAGGDGLSTAWIVVLASGGAVAAAGVGFAGGRHQGQQLPARG
jgi:hypothetical protein